MINRRCPQLQNSRRQVTGETKGVRSGWRLVAGVGLKQKVCELVAGRAARHQADNKNKKWGQGKILF